MAPGQYAHACACARLAICSTPAPTVGPELVNQAREFADPEVAIEEHPVADRRREVPVHPLLLAHWPVVFNEVDARPAG